MDLYILHKAVLATLYGNFPPLPLCYPIILCVYAVFSTGLLEAIFMEWELEETKEGGGQTDSD